MRNLTARLVAIAALVLGAVSAPAATTLYTKDNAPATPKLEDLALKDSVSQYGITWTFDKPARVGQFITGDWYVIGPVTIKAIDPAPVFGKDVLANPEWTAVPKKDDKGKAILDARGKPTYDYVSVDDAEIKAFGGGNARLKGDEKDKLTANPNYCRNGSVLNLQPTLDKSGLDSRVRHEIYSPALTTHLPIAMKAGDTLVSAASKKKLVKPKHYSPIEDVAILTCLKDPVPADAFRPGYCDREQTIYLARNLKRELLPTVEPVAAAPNVDALLKYFSRPWMEYNLFHEDHGPNQLDGYGQGLARRGGDTALLLCTNLKPEDKEPLLLAYTQFGLDLWGMLKAGYTGWQAYGGWNSGHKLPIILAGVLLGDEKMSYPSKTYPKASFQEDEQTAYGRSWTGAPVVFLGHSGIDTATGQGRIRGSNDWGPYEHLHPSKWLPSQWQSEAYRRCCTSRAWIGATLAAKLLKLEKYWDHDAYFDYEDRWMTEDETAAVKVMADLGHAQPDWGREGQVEIKFHEEMWAKYRPTLQPAVDAWKKKAPTDPGFQKAQSQPVDPKNAPKPPVDE